MIQKFRKKPVVVEAVQLRPETAKEVAEFVGAGDLADNKPQLMANPVSGELGLILRTSSGLVTAKENYWIIKGVNGEFYPCSPEVFAATYELVKEDDDGS